jgi:hypothetical protein
MFRAQPREGLGGRGLPDSQKLRSRASRKTGSLAGKAEVFAQGPPACSCGDSYSVLLQSPRHRVNCRRNPRREARSCNCHLNIHGRETRQPATSCRIESVRWRISTGDAGAIRVLWSVASETKPILTRLCAYLWVSLRSRSRFCFSSCSLFSLSNSSFLDTVSRS